MKEKLEILKEKLKSVFKHMFIYLIVIGATFASFLIGMYYQKMTHKPKKYNIEKIVKDEVNLAIDENNNLIIIEKQTGDYTIYEDSIGTSIFKLYAKNVWGQHNQN